MKESLSLLLVLILLCFNATPQEKDYVSGKIVNKDNEPVEFATLFNFTQNTSCITDKKGIFRLRAKLNDSIRIQHLNYKTKEIEIKDTSLRFILSKKEFLIHEITVSPKAAFDLFNTACRNTWKTFKNENLTRAYCNVTRTNGPDISRLIDMDLDIVQKKQKNFKLGEKILPYKIQERIVTDTALLARNLKLALNIFYPLIHEIYWVDLPENFNYYKIEEQENIKLYLISKKDFDQNCRIEVVITRSDTLLKSFAMVKKDLFAATDYYNHSDTFHIQKTEHFIGYDYSGGFGVLDKYYQNMKVKDPNNRHNSIAISQLLQTSNNGELDLKKRPKRRRIFRNVFDPDLVLNRYDNAFWLTFPDTDVPYDFHKLEDLEMGEKDQLDIIQKNNIKIGCHYCRK